MGRFLEFKPYLEDRFQTNLKLLVFVGTDQERVSLMGYRIFGINWLVLYWLTPLEFFKSFLPNWKVGWLVGWLVIRLLPYLGWRGPAIAVPHPPTLLQEWGPAPHIAMHWQIMMVTTIRMVRIYLGTLLFTQRRNFAPSLPAGSLPHSWICGWSLFLITLAAILLRPS